MKKSIATFLLIVLFSLVLLAGGYYGYTHFQDSHFFVEGIPYPKGAKRLDLRGKNISTAHYEAILEQLPDCDIIWDVAFQGSRYPSNSQSLTVTGFSQADMDRILEHFPNLTELNAQGCQDYSLLEAFQEARPGCRITYTVDLGGKAFSSDVTTLLLEQGDYTMDALMENLPHLPNLTSIHMPTPNLTKEQLQTLRSTFDSISITATVEVLGREYDDLTTTQLDFSNLTAAEAALAAQQISNLPNLSFVELTKNGVCNLTRDQVRLLTQAAPQAAFSYSFDFYGRTLSSSDEEAVFRDMYIGDEGEAELRMALDLMPRCKRFVLDNCGFSNEVLAAVRDDYRHQTKVVWRVWFGKGGSSLTDVTILRSINDLVDSNCHDMIYCEDTVFMDVGHNLQLYTAEFVAGMPNLEYCIFSGSPIQDLTPFENCTKLKMLELTFCGYVKDISPLAACTQLEKLNISHTKVQDITVLNDLPMTNLNCQSTWVSAKKQVQFKKDNPDCWAVFGGENEYGRGWRYDGSLDKFLPWYQLMRDVFIYDLELKAPNHTGWYATEEQLDRA